MSTSSVSIRRTLASWIFGVAVTATGAGCLSSCRSEVDVSAVGPDTLVLEIGRGTSRESLRETLMRVLETRGEGPVAVVGPRQTSAPPPRVVRRQAVLAPGESLSELAARTLGSAARWTEIAELNQISDPARVPSGTRLRLPSEGQ